MAQKSILELTEITDIEETDIFYVVRGAGAGRDKQAAAVTIIPKVLGAAVTAAIDLSAYKTDLIITATAAVTLTLSNNLPSGKFLTVIAGSGVVTLAGVITQVINSGKSNSWVSDGSAFYINSNSTTESYRTSVLITNADYTNTIDDGYDTVRFSTSTTNRTATLLNVSGNLDRKITLIKTDATSGYVSVVGTGLTNVRLISQGNRVTLKYNGTSWDVLDSHITWDSGWVNLADWTDATLGVTHNLGVELPDLEGKIYTSASGVDGADNFEISFNVSYTSVTYGAQLQGNNSVSVVFQTGQNGAIAMNTSGSIYAITTGYYRIKLKRIL